MTDKIYNEIVGGLDEYLLLNEKSMHCIQKIIDACKEKKFLTYKQNIALKRMKRAIEKDDRNEIGSAWIEVKRWGSKAKLIDLTG